MIKRALFLSFLLLAFAASAFAQPAGARPAATPGRTTTADPPAPAPAGGAPQTVALPMSKMAVIYTDLFLDEKTGIQKFTIVI